ncbi:hypothetical protein CK222_26980 [Mesorhizobium sp. WSM3866]|nr:hypothetical protein CK222_26980 [Mesorhizobium sp. WSM3866]
MIAPLSKKLRERIVFAIEAGESCRSVAARFGIAVSSVVKWTQRYRMSGSVEQMSGRRRRVLDPHRDFIQERIANAPHLTLHQLKAELEAHGVKVSHDTICQFLRGDWLSFKGCSSSVQASRGDASAWP